MQLGTFLHGLVQAQSVPRDFPGEHDPYFSTADEAGSLLRLVSALPHFQSANIRGGKIQGYIHRLTMPSWSAFGTFRGIEESAKKQGRSNPNYAETKHFLMLRMDQAPREVRDLAIKLSRIAGKPVNYFALVGYADKTHYIDWHQHGEDRGRDARVFILSLGATRQFGLREICPECRVCDACNQSACDGHRSSCPDCVGAKAHKEMCPITNDKTKWHQFYPAHGSLTTLSNEVNYTHEHAVLPDKNIKGMRISINTKCLPTDETLEHFIERMQGEPSPLSPDTPEEQLQKRFTMARSLGNKWNLPINEPAKKMAAELMAEFPAKVWDCHKGKQYPKYPDGAVYVGCKTLDRKTGETTWEGSIFGNAKDPFANPGHPDSHSRSPMGKTAAEFREYAVKRMQEPEFAAQVEALRGHDLLCWCEPSNENCHAKIWLELANRTKEIA